MAEEKNSGPVLNEEAVDYLKAEGRELSFETGDRIVRRGDPGCAFYVVLSGEAEVRLEGDGGQTLPLKRLGPGHSFGEMSLLRNKAVSADVVALGPVRVLAYPGDLFSGALARCEPLRAGLMARMARDLEETSFDTWSFFQRAEALNLLMRREVGGGKLVARSGHMRRAVRGLKEMAAKPGPVLIVGEPGAGKLFLAGQLHEAAHGADAPFIVVDCRRLAGESDVERVLFGTSGRALEKGRVRGAGVLHLAHGGTLALRHVEALSGEAQEALAAYLEAQGMAGEGLFPDARVVATAGKNSEAMLGNGTMTRGLAALLSRRTLTMPRLADRRNDILPLARLFLSERSDGRGLKLSTDAEHRLLSQKYQHRNAAELREAVELAALFAEGGEIHAECIFTGPKDEGSPTEVDLGKVPFVRRLVQGRAIGAARFVVLLSFLGIAAAAVVAGRTVTGRWANGLIWGLWEPAVILLFLFFGHIWCTVCPLSTAGRAVQRVVCLSRPPPKWVKRFGLGLGILGFFLIVWTERIFHMTENPVASGVLLLSLTGLAVAFCMAYQREVWCRYVCPLGLLAASYSLPASLHVRANPSVCATYCTTHECFKGTDKAEGCSVYHHPLYVGESHLCKLCLNCLRVCPHQSTRLYARPPLQAVWRWGGFSEALTPFALAVFLFAPVMLAAQGSGWIATSAGLTIMGVLAVLAGVLLSWRMPSILAGQDGKPDHGVASRTAFALLVLAWGPLMAYQLANIPGLRDFRLHLTAGQRLPVPFAADGLGVLTALQVSCMVLACALALVTFWRIGAGLARQGIRPGKAGWRLVEGLGVVYALAVFLLLL